MLSSFQEVLVIPLYRCLYLFFTQGLWRAVLVDVSPDSCLVQQNLELQFPSSLILSTEVLTNLLTIPNAPNQDSPRRSLEGHDHARLISR